MDYRAKSSERYKTMRLETGEFIRRFLIYQRWVAVPGLPIVLEAGGQGQNRART